MQTVARESLGRDVDANCSTEKSRQRRIANCRTKKSTRNKEQVILSPKSQHGTKKKYSSQIVPHEEPHNEYIVPFKHNYKSIKSSDPATMQTVARKSQGRDVDAN